MTLETANREQVGRALDLARDGLRPFVERHLRRTRGGLGQIPALLRDTPYAEKADPLSDIAVIVIVVRAAWEELRSEIKRSIRSDFRNGIEEIKGHRDAWAHQESFSDEDTERVLDTVRRLLRTIGAREFEREQAQRMWEEFRARDSANGAVAGPAPPPAFVPEPDPEPAPPPAPEPEPEPAPPPAPEPAEAEHPDDDAFRRAATQQIEHLRQQSAERRAERERLKVHTAHLEADRDRIAREIASVAAERESVDADIQQIEDELRRVEHAIAPPAPDEPELDSVAEPEAPDPEVPDSVSGGAPQSETRTSLRSLRARVRTIPPPRLRRAIATIRGSNVAAESPTPAARPRKPRGRGRSRSRYTFTRPVAYTLFGARHEVRTFRDVLLGVCATLHERSPAEFERVLELRGRARPYFSRNPDDLHEAVQVARSGIFAEMNLSASGVVERCEQVVELCGFDPREFGVETR